MFGPNTCFTDTVVTNYCHRDMEFFKKYRYVLDLFSEKFNLKNYDIFFIPGSGTVGIETVISSCRAPINMIGHDGTFTRRWSEMSSAYAKESTQPENMFCLLETSVSKHFSKNNCIVDAISGFPYYDIPKETKVFITCLNKQLGSYVGVSVIGVRKDCWDMFDNNKMSYLNIFRYKHALEENQTPSTFPTYILDHFLKVLTYMDVDNLRRKIKSVSSDIVDVVGTENVLGETVCPVITIPKNRISKDIAIKYELYGINTNRPNYQIFTYSEDYSRYDSFIRDMLKCEKGV